MAVFIATADFLCLLCVHLYAFIYLELHTYLLIDCLELCHMKRLQTWL